ncbi:MAG TPA: hypothetical protein VGB20_01575 [bacterium]
MSVTEHARPTPEPSGSTHPIPQSILGQAILVTGAASEIGKAIALAPRNVSASHDFNQAPGE